MSKSRFLKPIIATGFVAAALTGSILTNFGMADTSNAPAATPVTVEQAQPVSSIAPLVTPEPSASPVAAPTIESVKSEVDNHETRITALEQATAAPGAPTQVVTLGVVTIPTPTPTPFPVQTVCHGNVCVGP